MRFSEFKVCESVVNSQVKQIQQFLISKGYDLGPTKDDGLMGPYTKDAIKKYMSLQTPAPSGDQPSTQSNIPTSPANISKTSSGDAMPAKGPISGHYGRMVTGPKGNKIPHPGVDIAAPAGSPVIAPDDGTVKFAGWGNTAGNLVELITNDGVKHRFMHLSKILVQAGANVKKGQPLGTVGNTGFSKGAHLHWEKYAGGRQLNPLAE